MLTFFCPLTLSSSLQVHSNEWYIAFKNFCALLHLCDFLLWNFFWRDKNPDYWLFMIWTWVIVNECNFPNLAITIDLIVYHNEFDLGLRLMVSWLHCVTIFETAVTFWFDFDLRLRIIQSSHVAYFGNDCCCQQVIVLIWLKMLPILLNSGLSRAGRCTINYGISLSANYCDCYFCFAGFRTNCHTLSCWLVFYDPSHWIFRLFLLSTMICKALLIARTYELCSHRLHYI